MIIWASRLHQQNELAQKQQEASEGRAGTSLARFAIRLKLLQRQEERRRQEEKETHLADVVTELLHSVFMFRQCLA